MSPQSTYTIKPRTWPIWVILALPGIPAIILYITEPKKMAALFLLGITILLGLMLLGFTRFLKIYIDNEVLAYHAYGRSKTMQWKAVKTSTVAWSIDGSHSVTLSWTYTSYDNQEIEIELGDYSRSDMRILAEQTIDKAKQANISTRIYGFAEGRFPLYLF